MTTPVVRSAGGVVGWPALRSSKARNPSMLPTAKRASAGTPASSAARPHSVANRSWATNALAPESDTMYAISGPTR